MSDLLKLTRGDFTWSRAEHELMENRKWTSSLYSFRKVRLVLLNESLYAMVEKISSFIALMNFATFA